MEKKIVLNDRDMEQVNGGTDQGNRPTPQGYTEAERQLIKEDTETILK